MAVDINGDGLIALGGTSSTQGRLRLAEDTDNGTNYIELTAPASVASNRTITFPDVTGTVLTNASAGTVLQVVQGTYSTTVTIASGTYADTGLSASITPTSATSKILILVNQQTRADRQNTAASTLVRILRDSTAIFTPDTSDSGWTIEVGGVAVTRLILDATKSLVYLDSPATTSSITYKTQGSTSKTSNGGEAVFQVQSSTSVITLMEIAA